MFSRKRTFGILLRHCLVIAIVSHIGFAHSAFAQVECVILTEENWDQYAPKGKEVDAIYGDIVLRNKHVIAVIAKPVSTRHANMTVKKVGGCIIDLTSTNDPNDQLSCFYPGGNLLQFTGGTDSIDFYSAQPSGADDGQGFADPQAASLPIKTNGYVQITFNGTTLPKQTGTTAAVQYHLAKGERHIRVTTTVDNGSEKVLPFPMRDMIRADKTFRNRITSDGQMICFYDDWFHQAYGVRTIGGNESTIVQKSKKNERNQIWTYHGHDTNSLTIPQGKMMEWRRDVFPAKDWWELEVIAGEMRAQQNNLKPVTSQGTVRFSIQVKDDVNPIEDARATISQANKEIAVARTGSSGKLEYLLPRGDYQLKVTANGRKDVVKKFSLKSDPDSETANLIEIQMTPLGTVSGSITDSAGNPIACKVSFDGIDGSPNPNFGPDSRAFAIKNVRYSENGNFEQPIGPGKYEAVISHGIEFDAVVVPITVVANETTELTAKLKRTVNSPGWVSTEYHSHSTPSGDNTSDQLGRVLNLLAEQIEFAPCTEHNRIDSYMPHLRRLDAVGVMQTCPGMELTGGPLPINHQNAFPMIMRKRTQDGGAPVTSGNPVVQIERLKFWDDKSEKLMQMNHPNLMSVLGDQDNNNEADAGFAKMFDSVDVVEIHPLKSIFDRPTELAAPGKRGNVAFNWLQLLNQGYRIPGVINADAHWNFHGSGFFRNYVISTTDDPANIDVMEMVRNSKAGKIVMTSGPYLSVQVMGDGLDGKPVAGEVGDDVALKKDSVELAIKVQCPNWIDVDRVQVIVNGRLEEDLNFTRRTHSNMFRNGTIKFEHKILVPLKEDAHLIVATKGGEGMKLGRPMGPNHGKKTPIAVSNPIFVDIDGDGFKPNKDRLGAPILMPTK